MNKIPNLLFILLLISSPAFPQNTKGPIQGPTLGIHFLFHDFQTASAIRSSSLSSVLRNKQFGKIKDMSAGLAINYLKGLSPKFDFTTTLAGSFLDYPHESTGTLGDNKLLLELDASIRGKMLPNNYLVSPYLQLGIGISKYQSYWGAIIPAGAGLQFNLSEEAIILVNSQYRFAVTQNTTSPHFFYSIGLAGMIGKKKPARNIPAQPLPVIPIEQDRDNDGIVDTADACPDIPGMGKFKGCPDTDNDDIPDFEDKCPRQKGIARYQGCPIPDTDGDGINDEEDKCVPVPGVPRYQGCPVPDRDQDGVNDETDKCPDVKGTVTNFGCPEIKEAVRAQVTLAAKNIHFATGSYTILKSSNNALNEVAKLMKEDMNLRLNIEGHTDNTGTKAKNQVLSEQRAKAVNDYLIKNGIDAARLKFAGFGQDRPVAENNTASSRSKNRRVELIISY
jgi:OmpA-OmpF porin, OOP family